LASAPSFKKFQAISYLILFLFVKEKMTHIIYLSRAKPEAATVEKNRAGMNRAEWIFLSFFADSRQAFIENLIDGFEDDL
jgi:hypothetical protein